MVLDDFGDSLGFDPVELKVESLSEESVARFYLFERMLLALDF